MILLKGFNPFLAKVLYLYKARDGGVNEILLPIKRDIF